jgi:hypothetical protein
VLSPFECASTRTKRSGQGWATSRRRDLSVFVALAGGRLSNRMAAGLLILVGVSAGWSGCAA